MSETKTALYEGMYIISAQLSDDARQKALDRITGGIEKQGGAIKKIHNWGRRRLAYEIDGHREGHYYIIYFDVPTPAIKELWHDYALNEDLVRYLTLRTEEVRETIEFKSFTEQ